MNKNIIKIAVIVICFGGSGLVLYFGMFKNSSRSVSVGGSLTANKGGSAEEELGPQEILPQGAFLDLSRGIDRKRFEYNIVSYPKLNPETEVGIDVNNLIKSKPEEE